MATEDKDPKSLINKTDINANKADEVKKLHRQETADNLGANEPKADGYRREETMKSNEDDENGSAADRNVSAKERESQQNYKRAEGAESRDSDEPYEDVLTPETYEGSPSDEMKNAEADQAGL